MTFKFPRYIQENLGVSYTKTQQPPCPPNNIIWSAYIITTNTEALYFDFSRYANNISFCLGLPRDRYHFTVTHTIVPNPLFTL